jgi:hypothetical protein
MCCHHCTRAQQLMLFLAERNIIVVAKISMQIQIIDSSIEPNSWVIIYSGSLLLFSGKGKTFLPNSFQYTV